MYIYTHAHFKIYFYIVTILFVAENGEALHRQQKQELELTVAQIMSSLMQNSD